jgi:hypothetical protein
MVETLMRSGLITFIVLALSARPFGQPAGDKLSALQKGIACAPPVVATFPPADALRILGSQASEPHDLNGNGDLLILNGGTARGLAVGQQFFVRGEHAALRGERVRSVNTQGWIAIASVNETTAIASVQNSCGPIMAGDFLEPFVAPEPPSNAERVDTSGELDFSAPARVLYGVDGHERVAAGDFVLIDRGADQGVTVGRRFAFYRDPSSPGLPLVAIGEAVVVSVGPAMSLVRVNEAKTEVQQSDYVVPRK